MYIDKISLTNFRNFGLVKEVSLPASGILVAAADNATGKTNFLESLALLLRGKSFRASMQDCVSWGEDNFLLEGKIWRDGEMNKTAVRYYTPTRKMRIEENGMPVSAVTLYANNPLVLFLPEDTFLFDRGPTQRRNFLNHILVAHSTYVATLVQYHRVLKQRNKVLKGTKSFAEVESWTDLLAEHAEVLWKYREELITFINSVVNSIYESLSGEAAKFEIEMVYGADMEKDYKKELERVFNIESRSGHTMYGPHRDDFIVTLDNRDARATLSRGQVRSLVLALKVASYRYIKQVVDEQPILLLDDVFSELDETRQKALLFNLPEAQTILTCTSLPETLKGRDNVFMLDLSEIIDTKKEEDKPPVTNEVAEEDKVEIKKHDIGERVAS